MSMRAIKYVVEHVRAGGFSQAVLLFLAECHNAETGQCNPSRETIREFFHSENAPCSLRRVERALKELREGGYIRSVKRACKSGLLNWYEIVGLDAWDSVQTGGNVQNERNPRNMGNPQTGGNVQNAPVVAYETYVTGSVQNVRGNPNKNPKEPETTISSSRRDSFAPDGANPAEVTGLENPAEVSAPVESVTDLDALNAELAATPERGDVPEAAVLFPPEIIEPAPAKAAHPRRTPRAFPLDAVLDAYAEICPQFRQPIRGTLQTTSKRYRDMRKGWDFFCQTVETENGEALTPTKALDYWRRFLEKASANNFLNGRTPRDAEHANWRPKLDYLLSERGINLVLEGARR